MGLCLCLCELSYPHGGSFPNEGLQLQAYSHIPLITPWVELHFLTKSSPFAHKNFALNLFCLMSIVLSFLIGCNLH